MMFLMIGLIIWIVAYVLKQNPKTNSVDLTQMLFALGLILFTVDCYMVYQGEMINDFYDGGTGITYRDVRWNATSNTTYTVDSDSYTLTDHKVGEWIAWQNANGQNIQYLAWVIGAIVILIFGYGILVMLRYVGLWSK